MYITVSSLKRDSINKLLPFFCRYMRWCVCNNVCNELVLFALLEDTFVGILHTVHKQIYEPITFELNYNWHILEVI